MNVAEISHSRSSQHQCRELNKLNVPAVPEGGRSQIQLVQFTSATCGGEGSETRYNTQECIKYNL